MFAEKFSVFANTSPNSAVRVIVEIFLGIRIVIKLEGGGRQTDIELIYESVIAPNLKDKDLQQAYGCGALSDIIPLLFKTGEIGSIASAIMRCAGYGKSIEARVHEEVKNS